MCCRIRLLNDMDDMSLDIIYLRLSRISIIYGLFLLFDFISYIDPKQQSTGLLVSLILNAYLFLDLRFIARKGPGQMSVDKQAAIWTGSCEFVSGACLFGANTTLHVKCHVLYFFFTFLPFFFTQAS